MYKYSFWKPHVHLISYLGRMKSSAPGTLLLRQVEVWSAQLAYLERPQPAQAKGLERAPPIKKPTPETGSCFLSFPFWASISFFVLKSIPCLQPSPSPDFHSPRLKHTHRHLHFSWIVFCPPSGSWGAWQTLSEHALGTRLNGTQGQEGTGHKDSRHTDSLGTFSSSCWKD